MAVATLGGGRVETVVADPDDYVDADFSGHPWAELVVAASLSQARRHEAAEVLLEDAERQFRTSEDRRGLGWACHVRATGALGRGQLDRLGELLSDVRVLLAGDEHFPADSLAHSGMVQFYAGDVREAILLAESALALARSAGNRRHEGVALVYLCFFEFWRGRFVRVERLIDAAEDTFAELNDPHEAFELPLVLALRGALSAVRGQVEDANEHYAKALELASALDIEWYKAIIIGLRAHFLGSAQPRQARNDARRSYDRLVELGDEWWQVWALRAQGIVETALGNHLAAGQMLAEALERSPGLQERALTLIAIGSLRVDAGDPAGAVEALRESVELARQVDVGYLLAWAASVLARADPVHAGEWYRLVREHDDGDLAYDVLLRTNVSICVLGEAGVWRGDERLRFPTRHAEAAIFALALADGHAIHDEVLAERLWPDAPADRIGGRLATMVWQARGGLGSDGWRLRRIHGLVQLDCRGVEVDVVRARDEGRRLLVATDDDAAAIHASVDALSRPLLPALQFEPWVQAEAIILSTLAARLKAILGG